MSNFTKADFNNIMNYLENLEDIYYKARTHFDPKVRLSLDDYDKLINPVYEIKFRVESDFSRGLFKDEE